MNIAVFCSGNGSNFQAIVDAKKRGRFKADIALMVCDNPDAYAIKRAEKESIRNFLVERNKFSSKQGFEESIAEELEKQDIGLICLAGYMQLLSPDFIEKYKNKILNIHPALLPSFKGAHGIKDAVDYGVKTTGVTVHFVTADMDAGPIILQEPVDVEEEDTEDRLAGKIHKIEHRLYPEAIRLFTEGKLSLIGRKVKILVVVAIFLSVFGFESKAMFSNDIIPVPGLTRKLPLPVTLKRFSVPKGDVLWTVIPDSKLLTMKVPIPTSFEEKQPKQVLGNRDKLELSFFNLYDIKEIMHSDSDSLLLYSPGIDTAKPLTSKQIEKMRIKSSVKAVRTLAEVMDSISFKIACSGINNLVDTAKKVINFRDHVGEKYHLHFKVDKNEALFRYKRRF